MSNEISCTKLQLPPEPLTRGLPPPDPHSLCPLSSTEFVEPPLKKKILGYATATKSSIWISPSSAGSRVFADEAIDGVGDKGQAIPHQFQRSHPVVY